MDRFLPPHRSDYKIAYDYNLHASPNPRLTEQLGTLVWFGGLYSDMMGTKAQFVVDQAQKIGLETLRFDYMGHGESEGDILDGTVGQWLQDAQAAIFHCLGDHMPVTLIGSSMGGWISLLLARKWQNEGFGDRLKKLVLIEPAPDFTQSIYEHKLDNTARAELEEKGIIELPSGYDDPYRFTKAFFDDGAKNSVMTDSAPITSNNTPVRMFYGLADNVVDTPTGMDALAKRLASEDIVITVDKMANHSFSRPQDLERLWQGILS